MNISTEDHFRWFAFDWEDEIQYFETQAAAIEWVESQIPLYFDDDDKEWNTDVKFLAIGCMTHAVEPFANNDSDYCDYRLVEIPLQASDPTSNFQLPTRKHHDSTQPTHAKPSTSQHRDQTHQNLFR
jgi:hypothetical protein